MSSFPPEGKGAALVGIAARNPEKRRPALFSLTPLLVASCALFSIDALIAAKYGNRTNYRHDYSPAHSAKIIRDLHIKARREGQKEVVGPCVSTLRQRMRSRMMLVIHDGVCVERYTELQWYVIGGIESDAGLVEPPHEACP